MLNQARLKPLPALADIPMGHAEPPECFAEPAGSQAAGSDVTLTAIAEGGENVQYRFWLRTAGVWAVVQSWSESDTWVWTGTTEGSYRLAVEARSGSNGDVKVKYLDYTIALE